MKQLNPKAVWLFFVRFIIGSLLPLIFLGGYFIAVLSSDRYNTSNISTSLGFLNWLWVIIPVFIILCFIWAKLSYKFYKYELTDLGFRKESGVIYKKYVTIPYDRIQNVDIYRGILARILGLSDLQIQTAGYSVAKGVSTEGRLPALSQEVAEALRDELIQRAHKSKNQGL